MEKKFVGFEQCRLGITGTPGTGKKSVGRALSRITGLELLSIRDFAVHHNLGTWQGKEFVVDLRKLRIQRIDTVGKIILGHLLPLAVSPDSLDFVAILRCSPDELKKRYVKRRYSLHKIKDNLESEVLDLIPVQALQTFGPKKVAEFDTTNHKEPKTVALQIVRTLQGRRKRSFGAMGWSCVASSSPERIKLLTASPYAAKIGKK